MISSELSRTCERMVSPRLGIVRRIAEIPLQPGEPALFVVAASCTRPRYFLRNAPPEAGAADYGVPANGVAFEREEALWRALGETCERYSAGIYADDALIVATRAELGAEALPVEQVIGFSERQYARPGFPFVRFDPHAPIRWVRARNLTTGRPSLVPAAMVYLGYEPVRPEEAFWPQVSTGMAAGRSLDQAILNGLCEVIERDAFMATWLLRRPPQRLDPRALEPRLAPRELALLTQPGFEVNLLAATTDLCVPCVLCLVRPCGRRIGVLGAAAGLCPRRTVVRAALEAFHTLNWAISLERTPRVVARDGVRELEDHVRYYLDECNGEHLAWLTLGAPAELAPEPLADAPADAQLRALIERLRTAGYEVHCVELTTCDVLELGFRTVRVIVPGLHPLNAGHDFVHEDDRRLRRVARHWGIPLPARLNPEPHPFP